MSTNILNKKRGCVFWRAFDPNFVLKMDLRWRLFGGGGGRLEKKTAVRGGGAYSGANAYSGERLFRGRRLFGKIRY